MRCLKGDATPEQATTGFATLVVVSRKEKAIGRQLADDDGDEKLEVAVQVGKVEVCRVQLYRSDRLKRDGDQGETADDKDGHFL